MKLYWKSVLFGVALTALLIGMLVATRLFQEVQPPMQERLYASETIDDIVPEEPELELVQEMANAMPTEALLPEIESVEIDAEVPEYPESQLAFSPDLAVDAMLEDRAPAALPVVQRPVAARKARVQKIRPKNVARRTQGISKKTVSKAHSKPRPKPRKPERPRRPVAKKQKAYYSPSELDGKPKLVRQGRFSWPRQAPGKSGKVVLELEIDQRGRVRVLRVHSATHPALAKAAKEIASGSRFTAPKRAGSKVKSRFLKTYHLKKR